MILFDKMDMFPLMELVSVNHSAVGYVRVCVHALDVVSKPQRKTKPKLFFDFDFDDI